MILGEDGWSFWFGQLEKWLVAARTFSPLSEIPVSPMVTWFEEKSMALRWSKLGGFPRHRLCKHHPPTCSICNKVGPYC